MGDGQPASAQGQGPLSEQSAASARPAGTDASPSSIRLTFRHDCAGVRNLRSTQAPDQRVRGG
eukprot:2918276-Prymnesium_polylepis.1